MVPPPPLSKPQRQLYQNVPPSNSSLLSPSHGLDGPKVAFAHSPRSNRSSATSLLLSQDNVPSSISEKYVLPLDPDAMGGGPEADDALHNPDPRKDRSYDQTGTIFTTRGLVNLGCVFILTAGIVALFAGYPIITYFTRHEMSSMGGFNIGGINASGQVPDLPGMRGLIDIDTPEEFHQKVDYVTGKTFQLVFSDEFNLDGRTFYPGDDPYWEAVDLHYWQTGNLEWYDPEALVTSNGSLVITLSKKRIHNLDYMGGMMSTWNKFCFTGGLVEASVILPGFHNVAGLWPAIWAMGNLGRAGYGASLDGMWPYSYDACDVGTAPNQTIGGLPIGATVDGDAGYDGVLSFLPGQRLSRCTCPGEAHPGPVHQNGDYVGRSAPEIDMFEAQVGGSAEGDGVGAVSQSGQWAPFNYAYEWKYNGTGYLIIEDETVSKMNSYAGGVYQQASSVVTKCNQRAYEHSGGEFSVYGFQYKPGFGDAYMSWIANGQLAWTIKQPGMGPDPIVEISDRPVPQEPMYLIMNLGMSPNFGAIDFDHLIFPTKMTVDWIRVYQDPDLINIGCDPDDFPTRAYIEQFAEAYTNPLLTTWEDDYKQPKPRNRLVDGCT